MDAALEIDSVYIKPSGCCTSERPTGGAIVDALPASVQAISPSSLALRRVIEEAVTTPGFLEEGGTLAFGCQHAYPHNSKAFLSLGLEAQLKGADACLVAVAHDLGLPVCIKPLYKKHSSHYYSPDPDEHIAAQRKGYVGSHFGLSINERDPEDVCGASSEEEYDYQFVFDKSDRRRNLIWCHDVSHQEVAEVFMTYGELRHLTYLICVHNMLALNRLCSCNLECKARATQCYQYAHMATSCCKLVS